MRYLLLLIFALPLMGCIHKAVELVRETPDKLQLIPLIKSAQDGDVEAQYELGQNYCCGSGTLENNGMALYWWCQAGKQGQADALYQIGTLFENTRGLVGSQIPIDPARAYAFYRLAEKAYQKDAGAARANLEKKLTDQQKRDAGYIIRNWPDAPCELPATLQPQPDPSHMIHDSKVKNTI